MFESGGTGEAVTRILIVTKNWLGDILFEFPAIASIQQAFPDAWISCLAPKRCHALLLSHPAVKEVISYDEKNEHRNFFKRFSVLRQIRKQSWDYGFLFHRSRSRAFLLWFGGVKNRIGYRSNRAFLLTHPVREPREKLHHVDYFLSMLTASGLVRKTVTEYQLPVKAEAEENVRKLLESKKVSGYVCFHLGANWEQKRWPVQHFAALGEHLAGKTGLKILITGGGGDRALGELFLKQAQRIEPVSLVGQTSLDDLAVLFKNAQFVVSADSGPMHVASAVGAKVAALFGPTDPALTGPRGVGESLIISYVPEGYRVPWYGKRFPPEGWMVCLRPETVFEAIEKKGWLDPFIRKP